MRSYLLALICLVSGQGCTAEPIRQDDPIEVKPGASALVEVAPGTLRRLPETFFGLNLEAQIFESDYVDPASGEVKPDLMRYFKAMPDTVYRYPGGLMANHFNWEWAMGRRPMRRAQKLGGWAAPAPAQFGVDEYLGFLPRVEGRFWYTLNINGWSDSSMEGEQPSDQMADSNARLAAHIVASGVPGPHFYQLGNELDRSEYEWSTDKYIQRARDTVRAVAPVDPQARFVAFLRDFNLKYHKSDGGSPYKPFNKAVLDALPMVDDLSFQYYYDDADNANVRSSIPWRLRMFKAAIRDAGEARHGRTPNVWITEHGRSRNSEMRGRGANAFTSGMGGAISAADFWVAVAQMPAIQGAFLYSVGQWNIFSNERRAAYPMPVYWALRVLRQIKLPNVVATSTTSPNASGYVGGYDVRAVALADDARGRFGFWMVNRAAKAQAVTVKLPELAGRPVTVVHDFVAGQEGVPADKDRSAPRVVLDPPGQAMRVGTDGSLALLLPASSVSSFRISPGS